MDLEKSSPENSPPDHHHHSNRSNSPTMATMVANGSAPNMPGPVGPVNKRYRPAPAKTFQCRGYGECRMVFSRSEHLARHIRKHTGERPFSCHCNKQFSRLDNLRQHAQTVHADKQEENEQMMRDLTSLHATMAAANKGGGTRRRAAPPAPSTLQLGGSSNNGSSSLHLIKQEETGSLPMDQRPGTSTGYEGSDLWPNESRRGGNHSFRDPGQSFLGSSQSHSFRNYGGQFSDSSRPRSRPTSSGLTDTRSLPPLAAVVSASIPAGVASQSLFSFPNSLTLKRPSTASRPGTAPASGKSAHYGSTGMGRHQPDFSLLHSGFGSGRSASSTFGSEHQQHFQLGASSDGSSPGAGEPIPHSPSGHDSPFYFHPPDSNSSTTSSGASPSSLGNNPRKRAFAGPDGPFDHASSSSSLREHHPPGSSSGLLGLSLSGLTGPGAGPDGLGYDYGSESRPQSRRLTVMELCNDSEQRPPSSSGRDQFVAGSGAFLLSAATAGSYGYGGYSSGYGTSSRPTTSSGLVSSASALHIFDRTSSPQSQPSPSQPQFAHHQHQQLGAGHGGVSPSSASSGATGNGGAGEASRGNGGGVYQPSFRSLQHQSGAGFGATAYAAAVPSPISTSSPSLASTPTPPLSAGILSSSSGAFASAQRNFQHQQSYSPYPQQSYPASYAHQQQHAPFPQHPSSQQFQQFAHSPTFSDTSGASVRGHSPYSPRSPLSDTTSAAAGSPFAPFVQPSRSPAPLLGDGGFGAQQQQQQQPYVGSGHGHGGGQHAGTQQLDGQVRIPISPYAAAAFGMMV